MFYVNGKVDESGKIRLLIFGKSLSRSTRELRSGSFIIIIFLDVE